MSLFHNVIVTGANRGLGLEFVKQLASKITCQNVVASCRDPNSAKDLLKLQENNPDKIHVKKLDVDEIDSFPDFAKDVEALLGNNGLTCLFNNAGVAPKATRYNLVKVEQMESTFKTNVIAPLFLSKAFIPLLKKNTNGSIIVNLSSSLGSISNNKKVMGTGGAGGGQYPYRSSKAALNMVTRSLSVDLQDFGIGVISIHPGWVRTDMGGPHATLSSHESVEGVLKVVADYDHSSQNGQFFDHKGNVFPW